MNPKPRDRTHPLMELAAYVTILGVGLTLVQDVAARLDPVSLSSLVSSGSLRVEAIIVGIAIFGLLLPSRRRPWAQRTGSLLITVVVEILLIIGLFAVAVPSWAPAILVFVIVPTCIRLPQGFRYGVYAAATLSAVVGIIAGAGFLHQWTTILALFAGFVAVAAFTESFRALRESSEETRKLLDGLVQAQMRVRELTVVEERQRLAQEMHDAVGHRLSVAAVELEAVTRLIESDPTKARRLAETSREQVREGLRELRAAVDSLRGPIKASAPLSVAIRDAAAAFEYGCDIAVATDIDPAVDALDADRAAVVLRCVQEGLTNVHRHAHARSASIRIALRPGAEQHDDVLLSLTDDGKAGGEAGADAAPRTDEGRRGFGLQSLQMRAQRLGGSVEFIPGVGGSRLSMILPFPRSEQ